MCCTKTQLSLGVLCGLEWTVTRISFWMGMVTLIGSICYDFKVKHQFCEHFDSFSLSFKTFQRNFHFLQEKNSMKTCFGLQTFFLNSSFILVCAFTHTPNNLFSHSPQKHFIFLNSTFSWKLEFIRSSPFDKNNSIGLKEEVLLIPIRSRTWPFTFSQLDSTPHTNIAKKRNFQFFFPLPHFSLLCCGYDLVVIALGFSA